MHLIGLARLGRDAELRHLGDGTPVANLALAFNHGKKDGEGNRPTQWIDATLWGDRAERLQQYLVKGQQLQVHLSDPHIETYQKNDGGTGFKLVARVDVIEFAGSAPQQGQQQQRQQPQQDYRQTRDGGQQQQKRKPSFEDLGDDIPFN